MKDLFKEYCELSKASNSVEFRQVLDSAFSLTFVEMLDAVQELDEPINVKIGLLDFHKKLHAHESFIF